MAETHVRRTVQDREAVGSKITGGCACERTGRRPESDQEGQTSFVSGVPSKPAIGRRLGSVPSRSPTEASG